MRIKTTAIFAILPVSCVAAAIIVPPSPFRWFGTAMAIFVVSLFFYVIGKRHRATAEAASAAPQDGQGLGRFQFSLGMLLGFVTLAVCLIAEITWQRQLESQWADAYRLMRVSEIVEEAAKKVLRSVPAVAAKRRAAATERLTTAENGTSDLTSRYQTVSCVPSRVIYGIG